MGHHKGAQKRTHTTSDKKIAANRANATHSTGPRTREGKAISARNAVRHGILASPIVNPALDGERGCARFNALLDGFVVYYKPKGGPEMSEVRRMADAWWRHEQTTRFERAAAYDAWQRGIYRCLNDGNWSQVLKDAQLDTVTLPSQRYAMLAARYFGMSDNAYYRAERALERKKKSRGAPLAEGADDEVPEMEPPTYFVPREEPAPPPEPEPREAEQLTPTHDSLGQLLAQALTMQGKTREEAALDTLQQALLKQGFRFGAAERARLDPLRLWPEWAGGKKLSRGDFGAILWEAGVVRPQDQEELDEEDEEDEDGGEADPSGRPEPGEGAQPSDGSNDVIPKGSDYQTNPNSPACTGSARREEGEDPPSGA